MCTLDGAGCALAAPGGGFAGVADALRVTRTAAAYLNSPAAAGLDDLKLIAQAAYEAWRELEPDPDDDPRGKGFPDRHLHLDTTLDGAGRIGGDLTPECAAAVTAVLESLGKNRGPGDLRTAGQRYHDALQEACAPQPRVCGPMRRCRTKSDPFPVITEERSVRQLALIMTGLYNGSYGDHSDHRGEGPDRGARRASCARA